MKVQVTLSVSVDPVDDKDRSCSLENLGQDRIEHAVAQAILRAVLYAEGEGHTHSLDDKISMLLEGGVSAKVDV